MSQQDSNGRNESQTNNLAFDRIEDALSVVLTDLEEAEDGVPDAFEEDADDIEDHVRQIRGAIDDAQDEERANPLGPVPAYMDYAQTLADILEDETGSAAFDRISDGLEDVEDYFTGVKFSPTKWYADVNGIPDIYDDQEVSPTTLKRQGSIDGDPDDYTLYGLPTRSADIDESNVTIPPEDDEPVDLDEIRHFKTEKEHGGVV